MKYELFDVVVINPLWNDQDIDEDFIEIKLLIGLFGMIISLWTLQITFTAVFIKAFMASFGQKSGLLLSLMTNPFFNLILSCVIAPLWLNLLLKYNIRFEGVNLSKRWTLFSTEIHETLSLQIDEGEGGKIKAKFILILWIIVFFGILTGIFYALIYYIPFFMLFLFIAFIVSNFTGIVSGLFIMAIFSSWIIILYYISIRKLEMKESSNEKTVFKEYPISQRNLSIVNSEEPPIICPECRSFIAANSVICPVCGDQIPEDNDL